MSHHLGLKKHVTTQLELLDESSSHLQSSIIDFVQQIKTRAMECVENNSGTNMTIKEALAMVTTAQSTLIEHEDMLTESIKLYPPTVMTGEKTTTESKSMKPRTVEDNFNQCNSETIRRLKDIETTLTSLQDTKQKTEDDISEIKQWRDNFVTKQIDMVVKVDNLSRKQKQNLKNLKKQLNDNYIKIQEMNQQFESLKTKESDTDKTLEKLSLDIKEYESNLHTLNKEMRVYTDKTDHVTQEIKRHSDLISAIQENTIKTFDTLLSKLVVICKLLHQRLMPIDKMIETYNQNSETREGKKKKIETLEKDVLKLSLDLQSIANQQMKHSTLGFIASKGRWDGTYAKGDQVNTFSAVERNVGNHFDPNTGMFTAPVDGLYKARLTIIKTKDRAVRAFFVHISGGVKSWLSDVWAKNKSVEASTTTEVYMKAGDVLYLYTSSVEFEFTHFSCVFLGV